MSRGANNGHLEAWHDASTHVSASHKRSMMEGISSIQLGKAGFAFSLVRSSDENDATSTKEKEKTQDIMAPTVFH